MRMKEDEEATLTDRARLASKLNNDDDETKFASRDFVGGYVDVGIGEESKDEMNKLF